MKLVPCLLSLSLLAAAPVAFSAEQEETFTIPESGADNIDPNKLSALADRSDPRAINNVGWLWARGEGGVKQDFKEAMQWFKHAAKLGYTPAMNNVGLLYAQGHGVKQSYEDAFKWWMRAAERGDAWAMNSVGDLYENGHGVPQNYELALSWYREAAREGDSLGMWNVGNFLELGLGAPKDVPEAGNWFRKSAERGYAPAIHRLGRMLQAGVIAGQPDLVEAYAHYAIASERYTAEDAEEAEENQRLLRVLGKQLSAEQQSAAQAKKEVLAGQYRKPEKPKTRDGSST